MTKNYIIQMVCVTTSGHIQVQSKGLQQGSVCLGFGGRIMEHYSCQKTLVIKFSE
jgi:hypothetical protein